MSDDSPGDLAVTGVLLVLFAAALGGVGAHRAALITEAQLEVAFGVGAVLLATVIAIAGGVLLVKGSLGVISE